MTRTNQWGWKEYAEVHIIVKLELENRENYGERRRYYLVLKECI
jgi:hypothetical protein